MKKLLILTTSIFLLAAACQKQAQVQPAQNQPSGQSGQQQENDQNSNLPTPPLPMLLPRIHGILKISDNSSKGNLMLVETDAAGGTSGKNVTIYLQTKRDFSTFLNKEVTAWIDGLPGQFILKDINEVK